MSQATILEFWRLVGVIATALLLGGMLGHTGWWLAGLLGLALLWHMRNLRRLERWLNRGQNQEPPESGGQWGVVLDHLARLQARNRSRKAKMALALARFREAASALPDAIVILRGNGEIDWFNDVAKELLNLRKPHDIGQPITNLLRSPQFLDYFNAGDYTERLEMSAPGDEGTSLLAQIVPYGKGEQLLVARDMTRLHRLEQTRKDFVANVSHELRTPLTVINGYLEALSDSEGEVPEEWGPQLRAMRQQSARMRSIVEELLLLARLEATGIQASAHPVPVAAIVASLYEEARILSGGQHEITCEADSDWGLLGNQDELQGAFSNLISNAVRYTPAGGEIHIRWYRDDDGEGHFEVRDTGIGIAAHDIPRLTERFYRVDTARSRETGGTGLGLAIVKHVLNRHRAQLHINSRPGKGSSFRCDFPAAQVARLDKSHAA